MDDAIQFFILFTGAVAIWLTQDENSTRRKYACIIGLIGQPFWIYSSYQAAQWGIFILSIIYLVSWLKGLKLYWVDEKIKISSVQ